MAGQQQRFCCEAGIVDCLDKPGKLARAAQKAMHKNRKQRSAWHVVQRGLVKILHFDAPHVFWQQTAILSYH